MSTREGLQGAAKGVVESQVANMERAYVDLDESEKPADTVIRNKVPPSSGVAASRRFVTGSAHCIPSTPLKTSTKLRPEPP